MKLFRRVIIIIFTLTLLLFGGAAYYTHLFLEYKNPQDTTLILPRGLSVRGISRVLAENKIVKDAVAFEVRLRLLGIAKNLKAGEYEFLEGATLEEITDKLVQGKTKIYKFTIPEGFNIRDVCRVVTEKKIMSTELCLELSHDVSLIKDNQTAKSLEGYLFPDTYTYDSQSSPQDIFKNMVSLFYKSVGEERIKKAAERGFSLHDLIIFASVVEKETGLASERPLIAGVFYNRLKINMPLQSDPTTIYGIKDFNGNLTRADLQRESEYNTYTRQGLPVGPICNPGLDALDAVLNPSATEAFYFVAKGDGSHYFSKTLDEHNNAVREYQLKR